MKKELQNFAHDVIKDYVNDLTPKGVELIKNASTQEGVINRYLKSINRNRINEDSPSRLVWKILFDFTNELTPVECDKIKDDQFLESYLSSYDLW